MPLSSGQFHALAGELAEGGFSRKVAGRPLGSSPDSGHMVSLPGRELTGEGITGPDLSKFTRANIDALKLHEHYLGGWTPPQGGESYVDVSKRHTDTPEGRVAARSAVFGGNQIAAYDVGRGESWYNPFHPKAGAGDVTIPQGEPSEATKKWWTEGGRADPGPRPS